MGYRRAGQDPKPASLVQEVTAVRWGRDELSSMPMAKKRTVDWLDGIHFYGLEDFRVLQSTGRVLISQKLARRKTRQC